MTDDSKNIRRESTSEVKGRFNDTLALINNAFSGKMFYQDEDLHEIYFENHQQGCFVSLFIKREEIDHQRFTSISVKQGLLRNKLVKNVLTFKDLRKVYISITPGSDVVFLFTELDRYTVLNVFKDTNIDIINGIDRRGDNKNMDTYAYENEKIKTFQEESNAKNKTLYDEVNEKKREEANKRRIFISL